MKALETGGSEMEGVLVNQSQEGVVRLIGCLSDDREEVQNEVLLVLSKLTSSRNENIKTLVVFNDAFDKIFDMMQQVGGATTTPRDAGLAVCLRVTRHISTWRAEQIPHSYRAAPASVVSPLMVSPAAWSVWQDGGVVEGTVITLDCLRLLANLVDDSPSTQRQFCQLGSLQRLAPFVDLTRYRDDYQDDDVEDSRGQRQQQALTMHQREGLRLTLQLLRLLVSTAPPTCVSGCLAWLC